tara:strand:- start:18 stop:233 length:216 start_codon:yes stop_codon:yes gene_type:complete
MVAKLYDNTVILARRWTEAPGHFIFADCRCENPDDGEVIYSDDDFIVSKDAIRVWFRTVETEETEEKKTNE